MAFSTISDMSNSTSYDGLLKDVYLPGLTETLFNDRSFTMLIQTMTPADIRFEGQRVIHAFETQGSAGFGPITEGGSFVNAVPVKGKQGSETLKYLNAYIELSGPLIATAATDRASFANAVKRHFKTNIRTAQNDMERQLMGKADGELCDVVTISLSATTFTVTGDAFFDTQFVEPGMYIEFRDDASNYGLRSAIDGTNAYATIASITKGAKALGPTTATAGTITTNETLTSNVADGDRIVRYGCYPATPGADWYDDCREINGLRNLVTDATNNSETTENYDYIWGIDRTASGNSYLKSYMHNFNSGALDEDELLNMQIMLESQYQASPNLLIVSPVAKKEYFSASAGADRRFNTNTAMDWVGGYQGLGVQIGSRQLMLTSLNSIPRGYLYMIDTRDFAFCTASSGFQWKLGDGNNVLQQSHTKDTKFASAVNYLQFVCFDPGRQGKGYGVQDTGA